MKWAYLIVHCVKNRRNIHKRILIYDLKKLSVALHYNHTLYDYIEFWKEWTFHIGFYNVIFPVLYVLRVALQSCPEGFIHLSALYYTLTAQITMTNDLNFHRWCCFLCSVVKVHHMCSGDKAFRRAFAFLSQALSQHFLPSGTAGACF